jgi:hypothetical protein
MFPSSKTHSQKDQRENDPDSKRHAVAFFENTFGFVLKTPLKDQRELYKKGDFIMYDGDTPTLTEVARKREWENRGEWYSKSFTTVDIEERKNALKAERFIMFNCTYDTLAMTTVRQIMKYKPEAKHTVITEGEGFRKVPLNEWQFYRKLKNGKWEPFVPDMTLPDVQFEIDKNG